MHVLPRILLTWACAMAGCASSSFAADAYEEAPTAEAAPAGYPLDELSRSVIPGQKLSCEGDGLVTYRGERVRYYKPLRVHVAFREKLREFESMLASVGEAHFGRAPRRILHFGAYACRPMRVRTHWISEHAFGNAIDVSGFEFGPLPKKARRETALSPALRRAFTVRVDKHWSSADRDAPFSAFLRALADAIIERPDVFRAFIGPGLPHHDNHFHLANPPYRLVKVGDVRRWGW